MKRGPGAGPTRGPAAVLWRGAILPALVVGVVVVAICATSGSRAAASALIGLAITVAAMSASSALMSLSKSWSPPAVMASALAGYAITVLVLAVAFVLLEPVRWLSGQRVGITMVTVVVAWLAGQVRAFARLRILAFDGGTQGDEHHGDAGRSGSPASPSEPSH